jgi:two-component system response regulator DctR
MVPSHFCRSHTTLANCSPLCSGGLAQFVENRNRAVELNSIQKRLDSLSPPEMSVLELMVAGRPNKVISTELEISLRTVDRRRSIVLEKMQVDSAPELARLLTLAETAPAI